MVKGSNVNFSAHGEKVSRLSQKNFAKSAGTDGMGRLRKFFFPRSSLLCYTGKKLSAHPSAKERDRLETNPPPGRRLGPHPGPGPLPHRLRLRRRVVRPAGHLRGGGPADGRGHREGLLRPEPRRGPPRRQHGGAGHRLASRHDEQVPEVALVALLGPPQQPRTQVCGIDPNHRQERIIPRPATPSPPASGTGGCQHRGR